MIKVIKVIDNPDGSANIVVEFNKEKLYPFLKEIYNVKRGSKKLVSKFICEAVVNYAKENKQCKLVK